MAEHTRGPWRVSPQDNYRVVQIVTEENGNLIATLPYRGTLVPLDDARLIAAAPDLLRALEQMLPIDWRDGSMDHWRGVAKARAAIARAKGEE